MYKFIRDEFMLWNNGVDLIDEFEDISINNGDTYMNINIIIYIKTNIII